MGQADKLIKSLDIFKKECRSLRQALVRQGKKDKMVISEKIEVTKIREGLKQFMVDKGINQTQLADMSGVSRQRIHQIIHNNANLNSNTIKKLEELICQN